MKDLYEKTHNLINKSANILIVSHNKPDADTLGTALCLRIWLGKKEKDITLACIDKPSRVFDCLPHIDEYVSEFELSEFDLIIVVDTGASYLTGFHDKYSEFFESDIPMINIDHHASNDFYGDINIVDSKAASVTLMLYRMFKYLGVNIDANMSTCLLAGLYGDTGSFMHSNTNEEVYEVAADLMQKGAKVAELSRRLFRTNSVSKLRLWGRVLENTEVTSDNVVLSTVREKDYDEVGALPDQLSGVIDYLNMVPGSKFSVLLNEDRKGNIKGSLRTRSNIDLSRIAAKFGGGGHPKASGFVIPGSIEDVSKNSLDF